MLTLGQKLHIVRKRKGINLATLAATCKSTAGYMSSLERDKIANPSITMIRRVADALGVSMAYLLDDAIEAETGDHELAALINRIAAMNDSERDLVAKFVAVVGS